MENPQQTDELIVALWAPAWPTKEVTVGLPEGYDWQMAKSGDTVEPIKMVIPKPEEVTPRALITKADLATAEKAVIIK